MARILLLGAGSNPANNMARSLHKTMPGIEIVGADVDAYGLKMSSCDTTIQLTTLPSEDAHEAELRYIVGELGIDLVWAQPDQEVEYLAGVNARIRRAYAMAVAEVELRRDGSDAHYLYTPPDKAPFDAEMIPCFLPHHRVIKACQDKLACARALGDEFAPASWEYGDGVWLEDGWPYWMRARKGAGSLAAKRVDNVSDAVAWRMVWPRLATSDFMVAEYLPGRDLSYTSVWDEGRVVAQAARERVKYLDTRTPSGQSSSPRVARIHHDEAFYAFCQAAVRHLHTTLEAGVPNGVFYLDCKEDADGSPKVTEINAGRFNTTSDFYVAAGCDVYGAMVASALGNNVHYQAPPESGYWVRMMDAEPRLVPADVFEGVKSAA